VGNGKGALSLDPLRARVDLLLELKRAWASEITVLPLMGWGGLADFFRFIFSRFSKNICPANFVKIYI
jgi:hypothetical protein